MNKVIEKGYLVEVTTWENDGDSYKTESVSVDSELQVKEILAVLQRFGSTNTHKKGYFGNADVYESRRAISELWDSLDFELDVHNLIGTWADGEYYRVVESVHVFHVEKEITLPEIPFKLTF